MKIIFGDLRVSHISLINLFYIYEFVNIYQKSVTFITFKGPREAWPSGIWPIKFAQGAGFDNF